MDQAQTLIKMLKAGYVIDCGRVDAENTGEDRMIGISLMRHIGLTIGFTPERALNSSGILPWRYIFYYPYEDCIHMRGDADVGPEHVIRLRDFDLAADFGFDDPTIDVPVEVSFSELCNELLDLG